MSDDNRQMLDELLRYHSGVRGSARITILGLQALIRAFEDVRATPREMGGLLAEVLAAVRSSRPKLIALIDLLAMFEEEFRPHLDDTDMVVAKEAAIRLLQEKIELYQSKAAAVTRHGLEHISSWNTILVHSASSVVTNILIEATRTLDLTFRVLVLQLDPVRTPQVARTLEEERIPHLIVPMHDLCHYQKDVDKLFLGALTITPDRKVVAPVGTAAVVSICHLAGIRSYLFANSLHYSKGVASTQQILKQREEVEEAASSYQVTRHSHDLVDLALIDVIVNEYGVVTLDEVSRRDATIS
ncbi:MAG TPA: hypothetical protein VGA70_10915 [Longimicrobiales bacterium]